MPKLKAAASSSRLQPVTFFLLGALALSLVAAGWAARRGVGTLAAGKPLAYKAPSGGAENRYTLRQRGNSLELSDDRTGEVLRVQPLAATSGVFIQGADGETNDTLTVDFGGGVFNVPEGIRYDGGAGGFDTLVISGGSVADERYEVKNSSDGVISLDRTQIFYSNIEPVNDTVPAATFTVNATAAAEQINIVNGPVVSGMQTTQVNSGASGTFELVNFANKTDVTVNGLGGNDTITLNVTTPAAGLSTLRVNGGGDGADTLSVTSFTLSGGTLSLLGVGVISQTGPINTANLAAQAGQVILNTVPNTVANLAGTTSSFVQFGFNFTNAGSLNVGTVDGVVGVSGINSDATPFGDITLKGGAGAVLTVSQPVTTPNGRIFFTFDDMAINNTVSAPSLGIFGPTIEGQTTLTPATVSRPVDLGTNSGGNLGLTDAELDHVTTSVLQIGTESPQYTGNVAVTAPITSNGYTTLEINTTGVVTNVGSGSITVTNLLVLSGTGISGPLTTAVSHLGFKNTGGAVNISNTGNLTIANIVGAPSLQNGAGDATNTGTTTTLSTTGSMTFGVNVTSAGGLALISGAGNFIGAGGGVTSTGGGVVFTDQSSVGHTWTIGPTSLAESPNAAIPYSTSISLNVGGGSGGDTFNVTPNSTIPITVNGNAPTTAPGDTLSVNTFGTTSPTLHITSSSGASKNGDYTFGDRQTVSFTNIETITTTGPLTAHGTTLSATEGVPFAGATVATFNSSDPLLPASNFTATINWGDGTAFTAGAITGNGGGTFTVKGDHTYAEEGSFNISVTIHDAFNNFDATANTAATVADAPLGVSPLSAGTHQSFTGVGGNNTSVTAGTANAAFNAFKTAIGGVDNGGNASPQAGGFRTINWDGVGLGLVDGAFTNEVINSHTVGIPTNRFQARGVEFEEVYAVADDGFQSVNPGAAGQFPAFSPTKTFAMFNDNTIDFSFVLPSAPNTAPVPAVSRGFGAIFLDVETPNTTSVEFFSGTTSLGKFFVPAGASGQAEFLGVLFQNAAVTKVHIELGTATLFSFNGSTSTSGPADITNGGDDLAVTDDFAYAEPVAIPTNVQLSASVGETVTARVASFTDQDPAGQASDFTAIIDWGDGTTSAGTITPNATGGFDVTGTHTYFSAGTFTIITAVKDIGGSSLDIFGAATVGGQSVLGSIQFGAPSAAAPENSGSATVNVTRTGDTSGPASVHFETSDGTAKQKSDYTFGSGTVQFAAGETSKQISVPLVNDAFVEGPETFFVTLSNPSSNFMLGSPGTIAVTITDDDTAPGPNPVDDTNFFVRQQYLDFLGREPDTSGFNFWTGQINACGSNAACLDGARVNVSAAFFLSTEFQETGGFVIRVQRAAFGRQSADPASRMPYLQFMRDKGQVAAGVVVLQPGFQAVLEANKQAYATQVVNSPAFLARFPVTPAAAYVDALFASAAVTPTTAERNAAIAAFGAGGTAGRVAALRSVADSDSLRAAEFRPSFVLLQYFGYLRRNPTDPPDSDDSGYQFWLSKLNAFNGDFQKAEMVRAFILSNEYRSRFGL